MTQDIGRIVEAVEIARMVANHRMALVSEEEQNDHPDGDQHENPTLHTRAIAAAKHGLDTIQAAAERRAEGSRLALVMRVASLPILTYHSVDDGGSVLATPAALFEWQMTHLLERGYRSVPLLRAVDSIRQRRPLPERVFVVTFDDGYESVHAVAAPILESCGFRATLFLVTGRCGRRSDWSGPGSGRRLLSWFQVRELHSRGHELGAHSVTHADLTALSSEEADREILSSKRHLGDQVGEEPKLFAHPYGRYNEQVQRLVRREFRGACSARLARASADDDPHELPRIDMFYFSQPARFAAFFAGGQGGYLRMRRMLRGLRERLVHRR